MQGGEADERAGNRDGGAGNRDGGSVAGPPAPTVKIDS